MQFSTGSVTDMGVSECPHCIKDTHLMLYQMSKHIKQEITKKITCSHELMGCYCSHLQLVTVLSCYTSIVCAHGHYDDWAACSMLIYMCLWFVWGAAIRRHVAIRRKAMSSAYFCLIHLWPSFLPSHLPLVHIFVRGNVENAMEVMIMIGTLNSKQLQVNLHISSYGHTYTDNRQTIHHIYLL